jgi:hypothetical protein
MCSIKNAQVNEMRTSCAQSKNNRPDAQHIGIPMLTNNFSDSCMWLIMQC